MSKAYIFVPWEIEHAANFWQDWTLEKMKSNWKRAQKSRAAEKSRDVSLIFHTGKKRKRLKSISDKDVVYIPAHCRVGSDEIFASQSGAHPLDYGQLAERVASSGLRPDFLGKVKLLGCNAGVGTDIYTGFSFVRNFALILSGKHDYHACIVVGYTGLVNFRYIEVEGKMKGKHKIVVDEDHQFLGRAKDFRVFFKNGEEIKVLEK